MQNLRWIAVIIFISFNLVSLKPLENDNDQGTCELGNCFDEEVSKKPTKKELCKFCHVVMPLIRLLLANNKTEHIPTIVDFICNEFKLTDPVVCDLTIQTYKVKTKYNNCIN